MFIYLDLPLFFMELKTYIQAHSWHFVSIITINCPNNYALWHFHYEIFHWTLCRTTFISNKLPYLTHQSSGFEGHSMGHIVLLLVFDISVIIFFFFHLINLHNTFDATLTLLEQCTFFWYCLFFGDLILLQRAVQAGILMMCYVSHSEGIIYF